MSNRVLFVDDEPQLLDAMRRQLRNRLEVETAVGAAAGLEAVKTKGPFAVVISDMRMPEMNGARFLALVRELSPDTVRMVLSGQADLESTLAAVNEGHVFRFLMKPCSTDMLLEIINAGIEQYRLVNAEKHLLENTLNATVKVLVEVLGLINPAAQQRASQIERYADAAVQALELPDAWKYHLAAMLSQLGCITLPAETLSKVYCGQPLSDEEKLLYDSHPEVASKLLARIPRLEDVAGMVAGQLGVPAKDLAHGNAKSWKPAQLGAAILWAAMRFDHLVNQGNAPKVAAQQLRLSTPQLPQAITDAMIVAPATGGRRESRSVDVKDLTVGMILESSVVTTTGLLLVARGSEITSALLGRLRTISSSMKFAEQIRVSVMMSA